MGFAYTYLGGERIRSYTESVPKDVRKIMGHPDLSRVEIEYYGEDLFGNVLWTIKSQLGRRDVRILKKGKDE